MNLQDTLYGIESQLGLEIDSLLPIAEQDTIGGFHPNAEIAKWGAGAVWEVEGQILYALVRAMQPLTVLEIGSGTGCSSNHISRAMQANGVGHLVTLDRGNTPHILDDLKAFVDVRPDDAINYLALQPDNSIDMIVEDADHSEELCEAIGNLAKDKLKPGGVLLSHDAAHPTVGRNVVSGYVRAGLNFRVFLTEPSDCGWLIWRKPGQVAKAEVTPADGIELSVDVDEAVLQVQEEYTVEPEPRVSTPAPEKKPRKPRKKAAK